MPKSTVSTLPQSGNVRLKVAMLKRGLKQIQLAERLRISPFRMSRIVCGRQLPTDDEEDRLAEILGESRRSLFRGGGI